MHVESEAKNAESADSFGRLSITRVSECRLEWVELECCESLIATNKVCARYIFYVNKIRLCFTLSIFL